MKRLDTGVENLDEKVGGGFFEGSVNLVTGKTGTGKTAFSASFIYAGIQNGEAGVYITTEENEEDVVEDVKEMFDWNLMDYSGDQGLLRIDSVKPVFPTVDIDNLNRLVRGYISDFMENLEKNIKEVDAQRVVIDSVSLIEMFVKDEYMARVVISSLIKKLKEMEVTALLVGTIPETSEGLTGGGIVEYLVDSVIKLEFTPISDRYNRTLEIRKMRRTDHAIEIFPIEITNEGLLITEDR
ncbi:MAG: RAD55 family ATPase [Candidatus Aenigmatarchaeota archaeon]